MEKRKSSIWRIELREICKILKDNGIDINKIPTRKTTSDGKRIPLTLKDISVDGIDIMKIIEENGLDYDFQIGYYIKRYRDAYNGTKGNLTQEEREEGEKLGIVLKHNENASVPIFKGRKISQFHLDYLNGILDKILNGQINTKEALELLKQASIENNEVVIKDSGSIKRCIQMLLKDRPKDFKLYQEMVKKNSGRRNPYRGKIGNQKPGLYHEKEAEFKKKIIEQYLPLIINGKTTLDSIRRELSCSDQTINTIIEDFYIKNNDLEGLQEYKIAKKRHIGATAEVRENAKREREEVENYNVVTNKEFLLLSPKEQELQMIMKIRLEQLKEEQRKTDTTKYVLATKERVKNNINIIMNYFKSKNGSNPDEIYFSDEEIRYMIFRYPTLSNRSEETLDEKLNVLTSYEEIDKKTAYEMIKSFPAIIGYEAERTRRQLDLFEQEGLIDAIISKPMRFMRSVSLNYALIQYAKERHNTSDLSDIKRSNIFMENSNLMRLYGISYNQLKEIYPYTYMDDEKNKEYTISPDEIGKIGYSGNAKSQEASNALNEATINNEKGE